MPPTANLALPTIEAAQAQKHVTHNEALRVIDALVQLAVADRDLNAPPGAPADGQRWIVKASPAPTGAWAGHGNHVAAWQDGAWAFSAPKTGWVAFVVDEGTLVAWNGSAWGDFFATVTSLQNLARLGVGTTADATNPLAAKLNNALFVAKTVAEGGDGDLRCKLSKESAADTLSLLLQTNFSGRAEIGLTGDDDFHFKVSPDGSSWFTAIRLDRNSGRVSFPAMGGPRETLAASRTYYVRTDGSDLNSGLADSAAGAFLTIQKAVDTISGLDLSIFQATVQVRDGTYTGAVALKRCLGAAAPIIQGNAATPANVQISVTGGHCLTNDGGGVWQVRDLKVATTTSGSGLAVMNGAEIKFQNLDFGVCANQHMTATAKGAITATGNYAVSGGAQSHAQAGGGGGQITLQTRTVSYSNSPHFSTANFECGTQGYIPCFSMTFINGGTVTGKRYDVALNGVIFTAGGGANYVPGNVAGTSATGGQYA